MAEHRPVKFGDRCYAPKGGTCYGTIRTVEQVTGHQSVKHPGWPMCSACKALFRPDGWFAGSGWEYEATVPPYARNRGAAAPEHAPEPPAARYSCGVDEVEW